MIIDVYGCLWMISDDFGFVWVVMKYFGILIGDFHFLDVLKYV
jgi:hypothetical protein